MHEAGEDHIRTMTLADAESNLLNAVYAACQLLEQLEYAGHLQGNGHHARQKIAVMAADELRRRWLPRNVPGLEWYPEYMEIAPEGIEMRNDAGRWEPFPVGQHVCNPTYKFRYAVLTESTK